MENFKKIIEAINQINTSIVIVTAFCGYMFYFIKKLHPFTTITTDIAVLKTEVSTISKELKPNGGKSMKDQMNDLQLSTKTILYRQRWILDNREEPIFETDEKGNFTWANSALIRLTDRLFKDLENNNWINALCEKTRTEVNDSWQIAIENKRNFEHEIIIIDSKDRAFSAKCIAVRQEDGKYVGKLINVEQLEESEKTF
jgi:PAS domain-containing protein